MNFDINFLIVFLLIFFITMSLVDYFLLSLKKLKKPIDLNRSSAEYNLFFFRYKSYFICLFSFFICRNFVFNNFFIPSSSMYPNLLKNSVVFVDRFSYGIKNPINNNIWIEISDPKRGDILVFHYPVNRSIYFVKRLIGLPGDHISYKNGQLSINSKFIPTYDCEEFSKESKHIICKESLNGKEYRINNSNTDKNIDFGSIEIPEDSYFVMGDNRGNSYDSRYWGFVNKSHVIGKVRFHWFR